MEENTLDILKIVLVLGSMPLWGPFAKALYEELQLAMRADGGLFGPTPSRIDRQLIEKELKHEQLRQVHEPLAHHGTNKRPGSTATASEDPLVDGAPQNSGPRHFRRSNSSQPRGGPQRRHFR